MYNFKKNYTDIQNRFDEKREKMAQKFNQAKAHMAHGFQNILIQR